MKCYQILFFVLRAASDKHSLINSTSENGLFRFTILWVRNKLASVAASYIENRLIKFACWFFKVFTNSRLFFFLSELVKCCPRLECFVWWCLFKLHSLTTATNSWPKKHTSLVPTSVKKYFSVHYSLIVIIILLFELNLHIIVYKVLLA